MLGYPDGVKGYRLFDVDSKKIVISRDVKFKEDKFPLKKMNAKTNHEKRGRSCSEADDEENAVSLDWVEEIRKEGEQIRPEGKQIRPEGEQIHPEGEQIHPGEELICPREESARREEELVHPEEQPVREVQSGRSLPRRSPRDPVPKQPYS